MTKKKKKRFGRSLFARVSGPFVPCCPLASVHAAASDAFSRLALGLPWLNSPRTFGSKFGRILFEEIDRDGEGCRGAEVCCTTSRCVCAILKLIRCGPWHDAGSLGDHWPSVPSSQQLSEHRSAAQPLHIEAPAWLYPSTHLFKDVLS